MRKLVVILLFAVLSTSASMAAVGRPSTIFVLNGALADHPQTVSTFSIVAIDPQNGDLGVAVASRYFSVGSVVPWAMAG